MTNFYTNVIQKDPRFATTDAVTDPALLEPRFRAAISAIIADAAALGHRLKIGETYRSVQHQQWLFAKGRTKLRNVGVHHYGLAADLLMIDAAGHYDPVGEHYAFLVDLAKKHPLPWGPMISGIDWGTPPASAHTFNDWDHLQGVTIAQQPALFAGTWYPQEM
jgi:hypothetical protein